jgi:hypothetical protein
VLGLELATPSPPLRAPRLRPSRPRSRCGPAPRRRTG